MQADEGQTDKAPDILDHTDARALDKHQATWGKSGWSGYDRTPHNTVMLGVATAATSTVDATAQTLTGDETIKAVEERLVVGKRADDGGHVRVRVHIAESPVEEPAHLRKKRGTIDRRPADPAAATADLTILAENTIGARAPIEEAVVGMEARLIDGIGVHRDATDRTETVRGTVRNT